MSKRIKVYLAGKVEKNCWRHSIVKGLQEVDWTGFSCNGGVGPFYDGSWPVLEAAIGGQHDYVGPFFVACDHGCWHRRDSHGVGAGPLAEVGHSSGLGSGLAQEEVVRLCFDAIDRADLVFVWLDANGPEETTAYGTLVEIGYAVARGKRVVIASEHAGDGDSEWLWFARTAAARSAGLERSTVFAPSPAEALTGVLEALSPNVLDACESPIETALGSELFPLFKNRLLAQHEVNVDGHRYRLDFAVVSDGMKIAIECDGHTFHERTKEQAARDRSRDRALTAAGWTVLRFTGSEIHRDAAKCAGEVFRVFSTGKR